MNLTKIWRYPVKTMAGESLTHATLGPLGIEGDRIVHVENQRGNVITSRTHPGFLGHHGSLGPDGEPSRRWSPVGQPRGHCECCEARGARCDSGTL